MLSHWARSHLESCQTSTVKLLPPALAKTIQMTNIHGEVPPLPWRKQSKWPQIGHVLSMWGVGRLRVHGPCYHRCVLKKVVEHSWSYKRSYLWCFRHPACGDLTGSTGIAYWTFFFFFWVPNHPCFSINDLQFATLTHLNNEPVFTIYFYRYLTNIPYICKFIIFCVYI